MEALRRIKIHKSINASILLFGGERDLMLMLILLCGALIFSSLTIVTTLIGLAVWAAGSIALRQMANIDPQMSKVFMAHWNKYRQPFYLSSSGLNSVGFKAPRKYGAGF